MRAERAAPSAAGGARLTVWKASRSRAKSSVRTAVVVVTCASVSLRSAVEPKVPPGPICATSTASSREPSSSTVEAVTLMPPR